eukprot:scaffold45922_cov63-Attheya_sp.AAC.1
MQQRSILLVTQVNRHRVTEPDRNPPAAAAEGNPQPAGMSWIVFRYERKKKYKIAVHSMREIVEDAFANTPFIWQKWQKWGSWGTCLAKSHSLNAFKMSAKCNDNFMTCCDA